SENRVVEYRVKGLIDQLRAVVKRHQLNALGEQGSVELLDCLLDVSEGHGWIFSASHDYDSLDAVVFLVSPEDPGLRQVVDDDMAHVGYDDRSAARVLHEDVLKLPVVGDPAEPPDDQRGAASFQKAASAAAVIGPDGGHDFLKPHAVLEELG